MNFTSNSYWEIFVRDCTIAICIKLREQVVESFVGNCHTPVIKHKSKFARLYHTSLAYIQVHECFTQRFPLELNFGKNFLNKVISYKLHIIFFEVLYSSIELLYACIKLWIFDGVMPEVKAFTHVDRAAEPPWKVSVVDSTLFLAVFIVDELFQVVVLYLSLSTKIL